jgi:hypothetical protein
MLEDESHYQRQREPGQERLVNGIEPGAYLMFDLWDQIGRGAGSISGWMCKILTDSKSSGLGQRTI